MPNENFCNVTNDVPASARPQVFASKGSCSDARLVPAWLLLVSLLWAPFCALADQPSLGERLEGYYAREGNDGSPAATAGNNIYLKFYQDRWIGLLFVPYPYAVGLEPQRLRSAFENARSRTHGPAYLRDRFDSFDQLATAQIERYGYLNDQIAFECGALSACTVKLGEGYLELIKPGVINPNIVRYLYVEAN